MHNIFILSNPRLHGITVSTPWARWAMDAQIHVPRDISQLIVLEIFILKLGDAHLKCLHKNYDLIDTA